MNNALASLAQCKDVASLRSALQTLCSGFGSVPRMDILTSTDSGKRQAVCFVRLDSPEQERQLMTQLGAGQFGSELLMVVDLMA